jgi:hypothetical protein
MEHAFQYVFIGAAFAAISHRVSPNHSDIQPYETPSDSLDGQPYEITKRMPFFVIPKSSSFVLNGMTGAGGCTIFQRE